MRIVKVRKENVVVSKFQRHTDYKGLGSFICTCRLVNGEYKLVNLLHRLLFYSQPFYCR